MKQTDSEGMREGPFEERQEDEGHLEEEVLDWGHQATTGIRCTRAAQNIHE